MEYFILHYSEVLVSGKTFMSNRN